MLRTLIAAFAVGCCSLAATAETHVITTDNTAFVPDVVNAAPGDIIRWEYGTGYPHTVTSGEGCVADGLFDAPLDGKNLDFEWVVPSDAASEIPYFCDPHCAMGMAGMIYVDHPRMSIGIVDVSACNVVYFEGDAKKSAAIEIFPSGPPEDQTGSFAWGVEIEDGDIEVTVYSSGDVYLHDASAGTSSPCATGTYTLLDGQKYMFHGSDEFYFLLSWPEQGDEEGMGMSIIADNVTIHSSSSDGDNVSFRAPGTGEMVMTLTAEEDMQVQMAVIANVTSPTLTLPASGEEADVEVPVGTHTIELNGDGTGMGMLLMQMGDGDDGGGGDDGCAEDLNGNGMVDVADLLQVIGAWGACP